MVEIVQNIKNAKTISGKIEYKIVVHNKGIRDTIVEIVIDILRVSINITLHTSIFRVTS